MFRYTEGDGTIAHRDHWELFTHYGVYTKFTPECEFYFSPWGQIAVTPGERIFIDLLALGEAIGCAPKPLDRNDPENVYQVKMTGDTVFVPLDTAENWLEGAACNFGDMRFGVYSVLLDATRKRAAADAARATAAAANARITRLENLRANAE